MSNVMDSDTNTNGSSPIFTNCSPWSFNECDEKLMPNDSKSVASSSTSEEQSSKTCQVCGDIAFGRHYNSVVCNGCKGFFRRSLYSQKTYVCRFKNDCEIRKESRNACRKCRLTKCFVIGMNPESVQLERNQYQQDTKNNYSLKRMIQTVRIPKEYTDVGVQTILCSTHFQSSNSSTNEQIQYNSNTNQQIQYNSNTNQQIQYNSNTNQQIQYQKQEAHNTLIRMSVSIEQTAWNLHDKLEDILVDLKPFAKLNMKFEAAFFNPEFVSRRYPMKFNGVKHVDPKLFACGWKRQFCFFIDWVTQLPDFKLLDFEDQLCIAKRRLVNVNWWSTAFHSYLNNVNGISFPNGSFQPFISDPKATEQQQLIDNFFEKLMPIFMKDIILTMQHLSFDFIEFVLVKALLFFRDEFFLSEPGLQIVRIARERYASALYKYILKKCDGDASEAINRYTEILNLIPPVLYLTSKINEKVECSSFFGIIDFDMLTQDVHSCSLFNERY